MLRKFFDHIERVEKVLCALIKFYLLYKHFEQDTLDKLDVFTRLAERGRQGPPYTGTSKIYSDS